MRVTLLFFAFTILFAVVIPQMVGTFLRHDDQVTQQLLEGADPTLILDETAAGKSAANCLDHGYDYFVTARNERFVQAPNSDYIAVLTNEKSVIYKLANQGNEARQLGLDEQPDIPEQQLVGALNDCLKSALKPRQSHIVIKHG